MSFKKDKPQTMKFNPTALKAKLFVATPMYGGMCTGMYASAVMQCVGTFGQAGIQMYYSFMMNESLITRARNSMAYDFLKSDATHLMFIDADIAFNPADIPRMVDADKDIICGIYPKKEINWMQVSDAVKNNVPPDQLQYHTGAFVLNLAHGEQSKTGNINEPIEIANGGTGFMLIKRKVFEDLSDKVPSYTNDMYHAVDTVREIKVIKEFFATSIDEESNRLLSEDYHFCKIARQAGFTVWCAPWASFSHTGTYNFSGQLPRSA
jgi:cellulose synthase/poly-beta-1,6-N-acetylglucosamine synthase-like glycosyltransferase